MSEQKISGEYAWVLMALSILCYDLLAIKTQTAETMSTALWNSLSNPVKAPIALVAWGILTHHLFMNKNARNSLRTLGSLLKDKIS